MPKKPDDIEFTPSQQAQQDPFSAFKESYDNLLAQRDDIERQIADLFQQQMINLQVYWSKLLDVRQEPSFKSYQTQQQPYNPYIQQPQQPVYSQVNEQELSATTKPKWEQEKGKDKTKGKRKLGKGFILVFIIIVLLMVVYMYLRYKGYSIVMPGL